MTSQQTVASDPHRPLRLWPGVVAAVLLCLIRFVVSPHLPRGRCHCHHWRRPRRTGHRGVVAVLQPGRLAGEARSTCGDDRCAHPRIASGARVDRHRDDGGDAPALLRPGDERGACRVGRHNPHPVEWNSTQFAGRHHPACVRILRLASDWWRARRRVRNSLALDADS